MTKDEELEKELQDAYNKLSEAEVKISKLRKQLHEYDRVRDVIVAAGLLSKDKFDEAIEIVSVIE